MVIATTRLLAVHGAFNCRVPFRASRRAGRTASRCLAVPDQPSPSQPDLSALADLFPPTTNLTELVTLAPALLNSPAADIYRRLDTHTRSGETERARHDALCRVARDLFVSTRGMDVEMDVPLAVLPHFSSNVAIDAPMVTLVDIQVSNPYHREQTQRHPQKMQTK